MCNKIPVSIGPIKSDPLLAWVGISREQVIRMTSAFVVSGRVAAAQAADATPAPITIVNEGLVNEK